MKFDLLALLGVAWASPLDLLAAEGEDCLSSKCQKGLFCFKTDTKGFCYPSNVKARGRCSSDNECEAENTKCGNFNIKGSISNCVPYWHMGRFVWSGKKEINPVANSTITVDTLATVAIDGFIDIEIQGPDVNDFIIELDPVGTFYTTKTSLIEATDQGKVSRSGDSLIIKDLPVNVPWDDSVNVDWFLKISYDGEEKLTLNKWELKLASRMD